jgi:hypothetical protein
MDTSLFIVLATYNGADYLAEQLDSIVAQTETRWTALIRDDGSSDNTPELIREYASGDTRFDIMRAVPEGGGASAQTNFAVLLAEAYARGAQYVFCCDQDDVWDSGKVRRVMERLRALEGPEKAPSLVHHDLAIVDKTLQPVMASFVEQMQLHPADQRNPQRLISRNEVTGCAMACNRALLEIALPIPEEAVMHDWWLALCAGFFGRLEFVPEPLMKYRQHGTNTIGAKSFWHGLNPLTNWVAGWQRGDEEFISTVRQAHAFRRLMGERLVGNSRACEILESYGELVAASRLERLQRLRDCQIWRSHWFLNVMLILRMILLPRTLP